LFCFDKENYQSVNQLVGVYFRSARVYNYTLKPLCEIYYLDGRWCRGGLNKM